MIIRILHRIAGPRQRRILGIGAVLIAALFCSPVGFTLGYALKTAPLPRAFYPMVAAYIMLAHVGKLIGILFAIAAPTYILVFLLNNGKLREVKLILAAWVLYIGGWLVYGCLRLPMNEWRMAAMRRTAARGASLITAVEKFHADNGRYPVVAEELVPRYLPSIPYTGMVGYPDFQYHGPGGRFRTYSIYVNTPLGFLNWDSFLYLPDKNYGEHYGKEIERVGDWGYHHE